MLKRTTFVASMAIALVGSLACNQRADGTKGAAGVPSALPSASVAKEPSEAPPGGCKASGDKPVELGNVVGDVYGFAGDATHLYYSSWDIYGNRGDVGAFRKDGQGATTLASLELEPRGLAVDGDTVYFTSGIRLMTIPKAGGPIKTPAPQFSSQAIALHASDVYGVPGDYGPYDRVARIPKKGGETKELASAKRPAGSAPPSGFSSIAVDDSGAYVADSGSNRVLRFALEGGKPKPIGTRQDKPYDLVVVGPAVYFNLAKKGDLMMVAKAGGTAKKLASGLVEKARITADEKAVYTTLVGKSEHDPQMLSKIVPETGEVKGVAPIQESDSVEAIALDGACVYWVQRRTGSKAIVYALSR
jgi:hypothetical protein